MSSVYLLKIHNKLQQPVNYFSRQDFKTWNNKSFFIWMFWVECGEARQRWRRSQQLCGSALTLVTIKGQCDRAYISLAAPSLYHLLFPLAVSSQRYAPMCGYVWVIQKAWERKREVANFPVHVSVELRGKLRQVGVCVCMRDVWVCVCVREELGDERGV